MKNIDSIIKYLSGEMLPDENEQFKRELSVNSELRTEFESVSVIWNEIRKQLQLKDGPDTAERELLIAEILAEHDINFYGKNPETKKEIDFRKSLHHSMLEAGKTETPKRKISPRIYSMISLMAAAMITVVVIILNPAPDLDELISSYYQPGSDPVFEKVNGTSRSGAGSAMALFNQGNYKTARSIAFEEMTKYPDITEIQLLYALSSYESGDFAEAESHLIAISEGDNKEIKETARWYLSLLYIKTGNKGKAKSNLGKLEYDDGFYQKKASKLMRKMR